MHLRRLKDLREDHDLTQNQLLEKLEYSIHQQTYSNYENGNRDIPIDLLIQLSHFYGTSLDYLVGLTDVQKPYPRKK